MMILAIRTDSPEAELHIFEINSQISPSSREEQPEQKPRFLPGAMRNPEGVSHRPKATIKWHAHRKLAETIHKQINKLLMLQGLSLQQLDGIVVFKGPGSFTGLRIGFSVANSLAYAQKIPIVAKSGEDWLEKGISDLLSGKNDKIAAPEYGSPAKTTQPKR